MCLGDGMKFDNLPVKLVATAICLVVGLLPAPAAQADVRCVQDFLTKTAFDPGPVDGAWGRKTADALKDAFAQLDMTVDGGLGKGNTDAICSIFQGPEGPDIAERLALKVYPIRIKVDEAFFAEPTAYDFSRANIAKGVNYQDCQFWLKRYIPAENANNNMAEGRLSITDGWITIREAKWRVGGLSEPEQLIENTNLALTKSGALVGRIIYYERYIEVGDVSEPPIYVTMTKRHKPSARGFPNCETFFATNSWSEGSIVLFCIK